jgi:hypothetical protein
LFGHHEQHEQHAPLSAAEREKLLLDGATTRGMVSHTELAPDDRGRSRVRVVVDFKDGQRVEFGEELANLYQAEPGSQEAQRLAELRNAQQLKHADRIPKITIPLSDGSMVPVRYDEAHRARIVIDVPALHKRVLHDYIKSEQRPKEQPTGRRAVAGPPWVVPAHCPNCGAPVDQATACHDADPHCPFCTLPIPVSPLAS